jgi:hypothetical protein
MKELEARGVVTRHVDPGPPVKVMYELTDMGRSLERGRFQELKILGATVAAGGEGTRLGGARCSPRTRSRLAPERRRPPAPQPPRALALFIRRRVLQPQPRDRVLSAS